MDPIDFAAVQEQAKKFAHDAREWAKVFGVAGGDDAEATMILMTAAELIRFENGVRDRANPAVDYARQTASEIHKSKH